MIVETDHFGGAIAPEGGAGLLQQSGRVEDFRTHCADLWKLQGRGDQRLQPSGT